MTRYCDLEEFESLADFCIELQGEFNTLYEFADNFKAQVMKLQRQVKELKRQLPKTKRGLH